MHTVVQDIRFLVRAATRRPGVYGLALLTCALGVGTTTGMFSVVDTVLWRPLPYPGVDRIASVYLTRPKYRNDPAYASTWQRGLWSYPEYAEWRGSQSVFEDAAVYVSFAQTVTGPGETQRIPVGAASAMLFPMLGASPVIGRGFTESDAEDGEGHVVVLSHAFWMFRFGGDRAVIGREIRLEDEPYTIVGVLPDWFSLTDVTADLWTMIGGPPDESEREGHGYHMIARLKPGVSPERAEQETGRLVSGLWEVHSDRHDALVVPRQADMTREVRTPLKMLMVASLLLLAVSCVTVASLVLGLGIDREHELAVRSAIGAERGRIVRQLLTESFALAAAGGVAGTAIAFAVTTALIMIAPPGVPRLSDVSIDVRVLVFAMFTSMIVGMIVGLVPALFLTRGQLAERMRRQRVTTTRRLHAALVVAQLALACVLLIGAGLLARTMVKLDHVDPGFDASNVLTLRIQVPWRRLFQIDEFDGARYDQVFDRVRDAIAAVPGVEAVGLTRILPFAGDFFTNPILPEGYTLEPGESITGERIYASPNYIDLMHMRLLEGRTFTDADDRLDAPRVAIVTENLAHRFWPGGSAVGHTIRFFAGTVTIVGVVADIRDHTLTSAQDYYRYFMPRRQTTGEGGSFVIRVRPGIDPTSIAPAVRQRVWSVYPEIPILSIETLRARLSDSVAEQRYRARLIRVFAALAAVFGIVGVYGVTSRGVAARSREIGIRMVLGERRSGIVRLVLRQGLLLALMGSVIGLIVGVFSSRVLAAFLFETPTADPVTLVSVAIGLALLSLLACIGPSRRAASVDPMVAMRTE